MAFCLEGADMTAGRSRVVSADSIFHNQLPPACPRCASAGEWLAEGSGDSVAGGPAGSDDAYSEQADPLAEAVLRQ